MKLINIDLIGNRRTGRKTWNYKRLTDTARDRRPVELCFTLGFRLATTGAIGYLEAGALRVSSRGMLRDL